MSRSFSTRARSLFQIIWKNTERVAKYDDMITKSTGENPKFKGKADRVEVAGREHTSQKDPKPRVSGQIYNPDGVRITSGHWYHDGEVKFSKDEYNEPDQAEG